MFCFIAFFFAPLTASVRLTTAKSGASLWCKKGNLISYQKSNTLANKWWYFNAGTEVIAKVLDRDVREEVCKIFVTATGKSKDLAFSRDAHVVCDASNPDVMPWCQKCAESAVCRPLVSDIHFKMPDDKSCRIEYKGVDMVLTEEAITSPTFAQKMISDAKSGLCRATSALYFNYATQANAQMISNQMPLHDCSFTFYHQGQDGLISYIVPYDSLVYTSESPGIDFDKTVAKATGEKANFDWCNAGKWISFYMNGVNHVAQVINWRGAPKTDKLDATYCNLNLREIPTINIALPVTSLCQRMSELTPEDLRSRISLAHDSYNNGCMFRTPSGNQPISPIINDDGTFDEAKTVDELQKWAE